MQFITNFFPYFSSSILMETCIKFETPVKDIKENIRKKEAQIRDIIFKLFIHYYEKGYSLKKIRRKLLKSPAKIKIPTIKSLKKRLKKEFKKHVIYAIRHGIDKWDKKYYSSKRAVELKEGLERRKLII